MVRDCAITRRDASLKVIPKSSAMAGRARKMMLKLITIVTSDSPTAQNARHLYQAFSGAPGSHAGSFRRGLRDGLSVGHRRIGAQVWTCRMRLEYRTVVNLHRERS